jgi:hypothetical protein
LSPALAGWSAFVLCRYVCGAWRPAMLGGLLFAFSPFVLSRMLGNIDLTLMCPIPVGVYVTLRRFYGELSAPGFVAALAILIAAQFLLFAEIVASATLFGATAFLVAAPAMAQRERRRLFETAALAAAACAAAAVIVSPVSLLHVRLPDFAGRNFSPWHFATDLASLVIRPRSTSRAGAVLCADRVSDPRRAG